MNRVFLPLVLFVTLICSKQPASAVTIDWVAVGDSGNAPDPKTGRGAVNYAYRIGKYDVTNSQYREFLNSNDPLGTNGLGLYSTEMGKAGSNGGISYNPSGDVGSKYGVDPGRGDYPVNWVTWYSAIRFANWQNNGQVGGSTETGAYTLLGGTPTPSNADTITRNPGAQTFLPSENEWYKSAYYNPATSSYYLYPTSSDTTPIASAPTATPNSANYDSVVGKLTSVGAYSATKSPYGAFDMGGNLDQWNETLLGGGRQARGGNFVFGSVHLASIEFGLYAATAKSSGLGFRVASVPEPGTFVLISTAFAAAILVAYRRRARMHAL